MNEKDRTSAEDVDRVEPGIKDALIGAALGVLIIYLGTLIPITILSWMAIGIGVLFVVVMTAFVVLFVSKPMAGHIGPVVSRLRGHIRADAVLGPIRRDTKAQCWVATPRVAERTVRFFIEGGDVPDPRIVDRARDIVADFPALEQRVEQYLAREAEIEATSDAELADEIRSLRLSTLHLRSPDPASQVTIDFAGPDEDRFWSCVYETGELRALDYD